jgi:predicted signal transduction protein with EAL and GGDEF domain
MSVVRSALDATQLEPRDIQLGMPVEVIVSGHGDAVDNVWTLADIGVGTVLTRYGQAVGNLTLLESLPVREVELARSFLILNVCGLLSWGFVVEAGFGLSTSG